MPLRPDMDFRDYIEVLGRRKWIIIISFVSVFFGAVAYLVRTPPLFMSSTSILVIPQEAPENYVQTTVTLGIEGRLATIQQQVTSRTRLMKVVDEVGLFKKNRKELSQEDVIEEMRKRVEIDVVVQDQRRGRRGRGENEAFSISFSYEDPKLAMLTTSRLASLFIEENLKSRELQAVQTSGLLESQLKEMKAKLVAQEGKITQYKMRYAGELPQELQANLANMARLQDQYRMNASEIQSIEQRKVLLQSQFGQIEKDSQALVYGGGKVTVDTSQAATRELITELNSRRSKLAELSAQYTEDYPDVMRLRQEVKQLEEKLLAEAPKSGRVSNVREKNDSDPRTYMPMEGIVSNEYHRLKSQIGETEKEIDSAKQERVRIRARIGALQAKTDKAPSREQDMISLTRDYENLKNLYNDMQKKKVEANIAEELESRQKEEQFQILDPANLPEKPFKPDKKKIFVLAFLIGSMMGLGGAIVLEGGDQTLRGAKDFQHFFDLKVFACIPDIDEEADVRRKTLQLGAILGAVLLFLAGVLALLWFYEEQIRISLKI